MALSSIMTGALLSANTSRQIAHVQHATKKQMDGHAGVLDAEIKLDSARGGDRAGTSSGADLRPDPGTRPGALHRAQCGSCDPRDECLQPFLLPYRDTENFI